MNIGIMTFITDETLVMGKKQASWDDRMLGARVCEGDLYCSYEAPHALYRTTASPTSSREPVMA
jgi:hypothetical protein